MARFMMAGVALGLLVAVTGPARAQDTPSEIVQKAIKAYGGPEKLAKLKAATVKSKGTITIAGSKIPFTKETIADLSGKFKETMDLNVNGMKVVTRVSYNGSKAKIEANGMAVPIPDSIAKEFSETAHMMKLSQLLPLADSSIELSSLGEEQVNGKPAVGIKVKSAGHRDLNLYFDKETKLTVKVAFRTVDFQTQQEVTEERIVLEFQDYDGLKCAKKVDVLRDGTPLMTAEVTDMKFVDSFDASEFE
jgi:hypothetical protein